MYIFQCQKKIVDKVDIKVARTLYHIITNLYRIFNIYKMHSVVLNLYILYRVMSSLKFCGWLQGEVYYKVIRIAPCSKWRPYLLNFKCCFNAFPLLDYYCA